MTKILVSLPKEFLDEMDKAAHLEHRSRSELVREAVRRYLHSSGIPEIPRRLDPVVRRAVAIQEEIGRTLRGRWESAREIRRWRDSRRQ
jgi:Arc/MetJ-type ribon-helix-helix transcriptional regulator